MAIIATLDLPGVSSAQLDSLLQAVRVVPAPPGLIAHVESIGESGAQIVDVWDSRASLTRFLRERVEPIFTAAGVPRTAPPQVAEVHRMFFTDLSR